MTTTPDHIVTLYFSGFLDVPVSGAEIDDRLDQPAFDGFIMADLEDAALNAALDKLDIEVDSAYLDNKAGVGTELAEIEHAIRVDA